MPWGSGKLESEMGEATYTEYFWAKDLVRYIDANPGKLDFALQSRKGGQCATQQGCFIVDTALSSKQVTTSCMCAHPFLVAYHPAGPGLL